MVSSRAVGQPKCCDADHKLDKSCEPTPDENREFKERQERRNRRRKRGTKKHPHGKQTYAVREMTWKDKHCGSLLFDLDRSPEKLIKSLEKIEEEFKDIKGALIEQAKEIASGAIEDKLLKTAGVAGCEAIGTAIGGLIGSLFWGVGAAPGAVAGAAVGGAICTTAVIIDTATDIPKLWAKADWVKEEIGKIRRRVEELNKYQERIKKIEEIKKGFLPKSEKKKAIEKIKKPLLEAQEEAVNANPCLKSKRCELSAYRKSAASIYRHGDGKNKSPMDKLLKLDQKDGCCPGQRAHHVIPKSRVSKCPGYDHNRAPTVCVEGGNNSGTHGKLHMATDENTKKMVKGRYKHSPSANKEPSSMASAIEASAQAMSKEFGCDKICIKRELDKFYKKLCPNGVVLKDRNGKVIERDRDTNEDF